MRSLVRASVRRRAPHRALAAMGAGSFLLLAAMPALGQEAGVSSWSQVQGDASHSGVATAAPAPPYRQAWRFDPGIPGRFGVSAPVIAGDVAVTVGTRAVYGVDLGTGEEAWTVNRDFGPPVPAAVADAGESRVIVYTEGFGPSPPSEAFPSATPSGSSATVAPETGSPSPSGSPAADSSGEAFDSRVQAVDLDTREPVWAEPVQLDEISRSGVTVDGDTALVGDQGGTVTAIDLASGDVRWTYDAPGAVSTPIAVADGIAVISTEERLDVIPFLVGLRTADGTEAWRSELVQSQLGSTAQTTVPAIHDGTIYVAVVGDRSVHAIALTDGVERWATRLNAIASPRSALVPGGDALIAVDSSGEVYELDPGTGERRWDFAINGDSTLGAPVLTGTTVLVPTNLGSLIAIDSTQRLLVSRSAASGWSGYLGSMAVGPDLVVVLKGGRAPGLVAFSNDPGGRLLAEESPTVLAPARMVGYFALAAIPLALVLLLAGRFFLERMGPMELPEAEWDEDEGAMEEGDGSEGEPGGDEDA